jgi:hypothetical protein
MIFPFLQLLPAEAAAAWRGVLVHVALQAAVGTEATQTEKTGTRSVPVRSAINIPMAEV